MWHQEYDADEPFVVIEKRTGSASSFLWGLALGAAAALLFAPRSGLETRRDLRQRARRARFVAQDAAEDLTDAVVDRYEHTRTAVGQRITTAKQAIELKREQASEAIRAGREAAQQARAELERRIAETKAAYQAGANVAHTRRSVPAASTESDDDFDGSEGA